MWGPQAIALVNIAPITMAYDARLTSKWDLQTNLQLGGQGCMCTNVYIYIHTKYISICMSVCMYVCMYVCLYIYIYIHIPIITLKIYIHLRAISPVRGALSASATSASASAVAC